jgi:hypothetical protein
MLEIRQLSIGETFLCLITVHADALYLHTIVHHTHFIRPSELCECVQIMEQDGLPLSTVHHHAVPGRFQSFWIGFHFFSWIQTVPRCKEKRTGLVLLALKTLLRYTY